MKFLHISDLHLGKKINEFSMLEQQEYVLTQIIQIAIAKKVDGLLLAGDIYDKPIPPVEAIELFERFLVLLTKNKIAAYIIHGNHDSAQRLSFGSAFMQEHQIYMAKAYQGDILQITKEDAYGPVHIYLLPFIKPAYVRNGYPEEKIDDYQDALQVIIKNLNMNKEERNILLSHQFVLGAKTCESEEISIGGLDQISATVYQDFDYVALGHLHSPQAITSAIRYSGSIYPYSLSERNQNKVAIVFDIQEKGNITIEEIPLSFKNHLREIKGTYNQLTNKSFYQNFNLQDYYHIILTDEEDILDAIGKLRTIYPRIIQLNYENTRTAQSQQIVNLEEVEKKSPIELIDALYQLQNNQSLSLEQRQYCLDYFKEDKR